MNKTKITSFRVEDTDFTRTRKLPFWRVAVLIMSGWKTSIQNREDYKVEDFRWLYNKRWGVETYLDRLKNQLEVERFSSGKLIGIEQDFYGIVFLSTLESVLRCHCSRSEGKSGINQANNYVLGI